MRNEAIFNLYPSAVTVGNEGKFVLDKDQNPIAIDETKVAEEVKKLQSEYDAQEYARNRSSEYPSWQEQMDMQYWDAKNGTNTWQEAIEAVKTKYPKGE